MAAQQAQKSMDMYNSRATKYDNSHHPKFARDMLAFTPVKPGAHVLDLACGTGLVTLLAAHAAGRQGRVVGVDVSDGMLAEARHKLATATTDEDMAEVQLFQHSIADLDALPALRGLQGSFDLITCCSALVLLDEPAEALAQWRKYLKPGGRLNVDVIIDQNQIAMLLLEKSVRAVAPDVHPPYHRAWVTGEESVRSIMDKAGYQLETITLVRQLDWEVRWHEGTREKAVQVFRDMLGAASGAWSSIAEDLELRQRVEERFVELWLGQAKPKAASTEQWVEERDGVWVVVAGRKERE